MIKCLTHNEGRVFSVILVGDQNSSHDKSSEHNETKESRYNECNTILRICDRMTMRSGAEKSIDEER